MQRREVGAASWQMALVPVACLMFTVDGLWMLFAGANLGERAAGLLGVAFFGGGGLYFLRSRRRGGTRFYLRPDGFELTLTSDKGHFVPWTDVESIGTVKVGREEFTAIRLKSYWSYLASFTPDEARDYMRMLKGVRVLGYATSAIAALSGRDVKQLLDMLPSSEEVKGLASMLAFSRERYGAEILLPWSQRDRGAREFAAYLEEQRQAAGQL